MIRTLAIALAWFMGLFLLACIGLGVPLDLAIAVVFGWVFYLRRVLPDVRVAWDGVITAVVCLVLYLVGSHAFLGWLYGQSRGKPAPDDPTVPRWRPRWTIALGALVVLMFVAGLSAAGITHQVGWLLTSGEPLTEGGSIAMNRAQSMGHLKQIGLGLHNDQDVHKTFPPGGTFDAVGQPLHGWEAMLLPFIERADLHGRIDFGVPWDDPRNAPAFRTEVPLFLLRNVRDRKDGAGYALSHYAGNAQVLGGNVARTLADVKDGAASTIMAGEAAGEYRPWGYPANWRDPASGINRSPDGFGSPFPGGATFLFVDGSVRFLRNDINPQVLKALGTPAGGERLSPDSY